MATTVGVFFTFFFLCWGLKRYGVKFEYAFVAKEIFKVILASFFMGLAAWWTLSLLNQSNIPFAKVLDVFVPIVVGVLVYFILVKLLKSESFEWVIARRKKKA